MKLSHQLWNTNIQNQKYYDESPLCPICQILPESFSHIFCCSFSSARDHRQETLSQLQTSLHHGIPPELLNAILVGLIKWTESQPCASPLVGSRLPSLLAIHHAFLEQTELGWDAFVRGHISILWTQAFLANYVTKKNLSPHQTNSIVDRWMKLLVNQLWIFHQFSGTWSRGTLPSQQGTSRSTGMCYIIVFAISIRSLHGTAVPQLSV
jgi:hypothetical protein